MSNRNAAVATALDLDAITRQYQGLVTKATRLLNSKDLQYRSLNTRGAFFSLDDLTGISTTRLDVLSTARKVIESNPRFTVQGDLVIITSDRYPAITLRAFVQDFGI